MPEKTDLSESQRDAIRRINGERRRAQARHLRYRLAVLGPTTKAVIAHAGGLLFDRMMAGWSVTTLVADDSDPRPLEILGARVLDLESALAPDLRAALTSSDHTPWPHAVVVAGELCENDPRLEEGVERALERGATDIMMWGRSGVTSIDRRLSPLEHQLSNAARMFKAQALAAAAPTASGEVTVTERFRSSDLSVVGDGVLQHL
ncbi:hypothetical protein [Williamsia soli]|uniref:hypothetical protein n=1 Tax=Williamsia soli TaxID=364929 RepID=UPI001F393A11|nr:hypothetical protein [Williamsia soli]